MASSTSSTATTAATTLTESTETETETSETLRLKLKKKPEKKKIQWTEETVDNEGQLLEGCLWNFEHLLVFASVWQMLSICQVRQFPHICKEPLSVFVGFFLRSISDPVFAGLGKKKSKVCCQYKKPRADLDESSDSDSDCPGH